VPAAFDPGLDPGDLSAFQEPGVEIPDRTLVTIPFVV
jgi:hypothetical protein